MRKLSLTLVTALLLSYGSAFAHVSKKADPAKKLKRQVQSLLSGYEMPSEENLEATVLFTVNKEKEIVVLSVDTRDKALEDFVKVRLNYRRVSDASVPEGRRYTLPFKIVG